MANEEAKREQMSQIVAEHRNVDCEAEESCQPPSLRPKDRPIDNTVTLETTVNKLSLSERKRHSEPLPQHDSTDSRRQKCFERRRLWTASKQESFDLPEELKCPTEDNVFAEGVKSTQGWSGKTQYQRSFSVPATLPDIVPERNSRSGNSSPDVVSFGENLKPDHQPVKSILSTPSSTTGAALRMEEKEKKQNFEGAVHCEPLPVPQEIKRKRSVTFETVAQVVKIWSAKGMQARSHFLSSGYGSQSDNSQASQGSNVSSERGSIFADDFVVEKRSFDTVDSSQGDYPSVGSTIVDGNIDDSEEEKSGDKLGEESMQVNREHSQQVASSGQSPATSKPPTPEELDEIEIWRRENVPHFHYGNMDDVPNLSIFEKTKEMSSAYFPDTQSHGGEIVSKSPADEEHMPPPQSSDKLPHVVEFRRNSRTLDGEGSGSRTSPTTKEECQRELYKKLFEDRMLHFDPTKESIVDLFEWVKKNIGEALSPSPRSPFFPIERSPQNEHFRISPGLVAFTNTFEQGSIPSGGARDPLVLPGVVENPAAAPSQLPAPNPKSHPAPSQPSQDPLHVPETNVPLGLKNPGVPLTGSSSAGLGCRPGTQCPVWQQGQGWCRASDVGDGQGGEQMNGKGTAPYQQDLPAILDDVMSSIYSSSDLSSGISLGSIQVEELVRISQCSYVRCTEGACSQAKKGFRSLQDALKRGRHCLSGEDLHLLSLLNEHYNTCKLPNCPVPWCRYVCHSCGTKEGKTSQALMTLLSSPLFMLLPSSPQCQFDLFVKLDSHLSVDRTPQEWDDWLMLYPLSQTYTVALVTPLIPVWPPAQWVIKVATLHKQKKQVEVYRKLGDLRHAHIIPHVWVAASFPAQLLVVCTQFLPGVSVRDLLDQRVRLSCTQSCRYWLQILSATQRLHDHGIVFLNWTCGNLLLDQSCGTVKLTNFVASMELSSGTVDPEDVKLTLPADIVPAEMLVQGGELVPKTDSWGLACLLHEMLTGTRPWYHLRHRRPEDAWLQILKEVPPSITLDLPSFAQGTIHECLQKSPDCRPSVKKMMELCHSQCF